MEIKNKITLPSNPPFFHEEGNDKLVIFIHGLTGHCTDTWTWKDKKKPPFFWPEQLFNDPEFPGYDVLSFGYESGRGIAYNIKELSQSLKVTIDELIRAKNYQTISFVGHSLGGLVARQFILDRYTDHNIASVVLLATPNFGSGLAKVGEFFCNNSHLEELAHGGVIDRMNDDWQEIFKEKQGGEPFVYSAGYELRPVIKLEIVEKYSAIYFAHHVKGWLKNHINIAKPYGLDDELYIWVRQRLLKQPVVPQAVERSDEQEKAIPETLEKIYEIAKGTELEEAEELIGIGNLDGALDLLNQQEQTGNENLAKIHFVTGGVYELKLDYASAQTHYDKAANLQPDNTEYLLQAGQIHHIRSGYDKAIEYFEKALAINLKTHGGHHPGVAEYWNNLGLAWQYKGEYDKAIKYYEKALASGLNIFGPEHPEVANSWNNMGGAWDSKGEYDKAIDYYEKALASDLKTFGPDHPSVATRWNNLGAAWKAKGEYDKATEYYEKALASDLKTFGPDHPDVAIDWNNLGEAWRFKGEYDKAIEYFEKALASGLKTFGPDHPHVAMGRNNLGSAWKAKGEYDKAIEYYEKALASGLKTFGSDHPQVATNWNNLGSAWQSKGEYDKAIKYCEKALASDLKTFGPDHPSVATCWNNLGSAWKAKGDYDTAIEYYERGLASDLKTFGPDHPNVATRWNNLGLAWNSKGNYDKAIEYFEKALAVVEKRGLEHYAVITRKSLADAKAKQRAGK